MSQIMNVPARTFGSRLGLAAAALFVIAGCRPQRLELRASGDQPPDVLTLEEVWQTPLHSLRRRGHGYFEPEEVEVSCTPSARCKTLVTRAVQTSWVPALRLDVIALTPGKVEVEIRYRQPDSDEWLTEHVHLEFIPTPALPTLELGMGRPPGPFKYEHLSPELIAHGIKAPARCELEDDFLELYACFGASMVLGELRYLSRKRTKRTNPPISSGWFFVLLKRADSTGRIYRMEMSAFTNKGPEELGAWE